jgi:hypothetical protein
MSLLLRCMPLLFAAWCMLPVARCRSFAVRCILPAAWRMSSGCCLHVVCCIMRVVCCIFPVARCVVPVAHFPVVPCTLSLACRFECALPLVCFRPPAPVSPARMVCAVRRPVPRRISPGTCSALRVACCMLHSARSRWYVVSFPFPVPSCMSSHRHACYPHARKHARTHTSVCSRSRRRLRRSIASAAAVVPV